MLLKRKNILGNLKNKLSEGVYIKSSGTTGESKTIFRTPENLRYCNKSAIDSQKITKNSRIYTVCKMEHAGGMLAQTLPALSLGADIVVEEFNLTSKPEIPEVKFEIKASKLLFAENILELCKLSSKSL